MLIYLFYLLPFLILAIYALALPGCSWLPDWSLVFAGGVAQVGVTPKPPKSRDLGGNPHMGIGKGSGMGFGGADPRFGGQSLTRGCKWSSSCAW